MRMHYVPRLLLRRFADDGGLWELDSTTGVCERRSVDNAGKERHLYAIALETGFLKDIDADAAEILAEKVYDRDEVKLFDSERRRLAEWLATLVHRNPKKNADVEEFVTQALSDPASVLDPDVDYGHEYVETLKRQHPAEWRAAVAEVEAEKELADELKTVGAEELLRHAVMLDVNEQIRTGQFKGAISAKDIFSRTITPVRSQQWAAWMLEFGWDWLRSEREFIVGDDPLSRWSNRLKHIEYGLAHAGCEVTMPLSRHLCLRMRRQYPGSSVVQMCDYQTAAKYNNRLILAARKKLFGSCRQMRNEKERWNDIAAGRCRHPKGG